MFKDKNIQNAFAHILGELAMVLMFKFYLSRLGSLFGFKRPIGYRDAFAFLGSVSLLGSMWRYGAITRNERHEDFKKLTQEINRKMEERPKTDKPFKPSFHDI